MVKAHGVTGLVDGHLAAQLDGEVHARLGVQNRLHTAGAGQRFAHLHDQVGQLDQLDQDLVHIVHQRDHVAGGHTAHVDLNAAHIQQCHDGNVDDHIGQRAHQGRKVAHMELHSGQQVVGVLEAVDLVLLLVKGTHHAHTGQVLAGQAQHTVQPHLRGLVQRAGDDHHAEHHHTQQRDGHHEDQGGPRVDRKGHDHGTDHHKGAAQEQAQKQVQAALHLVDVAGHAGDEGAGAQGVHLRKAQALDVGKQGVPQGSGVAHRRLGRKILRREAAGQADDGQHKQDAAPHQDVVQVVGGNAHVDDIGHDQRYEQVKCGFQHLEQRGKHALALVVPQIAKHVVQGYFLLF